MAERNDSEWNKFVLASWNVVLSAVQGVGPGTAILNWNIDELEAKKFDNTWKMRYITTF